jgi:putative SOS response-associated peptidase YedK
VWDLRGGAAAQFLRQYKQETFGNLDASPTQRVPMLRVIRAADGAKELAEARWGLIPYWANGEPPKAFLRKKYQRPCESY